jgi:hypothetical protein
MDRRGELRNNQQAHSPSLQVASDLKAQYLKGLSTSDRKCPPQQHFSVSLRPKQNPQTPHCLRVSRSVLISPSELILFLEHDDELLLDAPAVSPAEMLENQNVGSFIDSDGRPVFVPEKKNVSCSSCRRKSLMILGWRFSNRDT